MNKVWSFGLFFGYIALLSNFGIGIFKGKIGFEKRVVEIRMNENE